MPRRRRSRPRRDAELASSFSDDDSSCRSGEKPQQRNAANARERARMRVLSKAFCRLKTTLPWVPADTKLSKLDTLRLATSYIAHLRAIMNEESPVHPLNLTWPFSFQQQSHQQQQPHQRAAYDNADLPLQENSSSSCPDGLDEESNLGPHHHHHGFLGVQHHQFSDALLHIG